MIYDASYGDARLCKCGHPYYRHFDTYDNMKSVGCKYCGCERFNAADGDDPTPLVFGRDHRTNVDWLRKHEKQFDLSMVWITDDNLVHIYGQDVTIVLTPDGDWFLEEKQYDQTDRYIGEPD